MKKQQLFYLFALLINLSIFSQESFSWNELIDSNCENRDFVPIVEEQISQGPCLSYAFISALETRYNITFNKREVNKSFLAVAYLDVKVGAGAQSIENYKKLETKTENGTVKFKIPSNKFHPNPISNKYSEFLPEVNMNVDIDPGKGTYNGFYGNAIKCINDQKHFTIKNDKGESGKFWVISENECGPSILDGDYLTVDSVDEFKPDNVDVEMIKAEIKNNGPIIMRVDGEYLDSIKKDSYYKKVAYHAYSIIGWDVGDNNSETKWELTDSWPKQSGIIFSKSINNSKLMDYINGGKIELHVLSGIKDKSGGPEGDPFDATAECVDPLALSPIHVELDHVFLGGYLYHRFWVNSNISVDNWVWEMANSSGYLKRSQVNESNSSSILMSPISSGTVTVTVRGYKNNVEVTKSRSIYLSYGQSPGGGGPGGW